MAFQVRQREPLLSADWQRFLTRRSMEFIGLILIGTGIALIFALATYSIEDPGWYTSTDSTVENILGPTGALVANRLIVTAGYASWCLVFFLIVWGVRLAYHQGEKRIISRFWYLPIMLMLASVYIATIDKPAGWDHHFGIGGMFGDTVLGGIIYSWPGHTETVTRTVRICASVLFIATSILVTGLNKSEFRIIAIAFVKLILRLLLLVIRIIFPRKKEQPHSNVKYATPPDESVEVTSQSDMYHLEQGLDVNEDWDDQDLTQEQKVSKPAFSKIFGKALKRETAEKQIDINFRRFVDTRITARQPGNTNYNIFQDSNDTFVQEVSDNAEQEALGTSIVKPKSSRRPRLSKQAKDEDVRVFPIFDDTSNYQHPPLSLLHSPEHIFPETQSMIALEQNARMLESVLDDYGIRGVIKAVRPGPVVTLYQFFPAPGLKTSRVISLSDDIARSMSAISARISTIPGESYIGIELPNSSRETVYFKELISRSEFGDTKKKLPIALGKNIGGGSVVVDLAKMPHLMIAGTTGSGKSVAINTMILSLLYSLSPEQCKLILIDPKMLELSVYEGIPHLLAPVVTDPKKAVVALKWVVSEMEERYRKMSKMGVRNVEGYNARMHEAMESGETIIRKVQTGFDSLTGEPVYETEKLEIEKLPFIVVVVDEMADLMMVAGKEIEACVQRLAQMARASGIHIVVATQRPSVDVITGVIKANFPTRVSFQVSQKVDSRTILGEQGAEQLLGMGDMLYMANGGRIKRVHGPFVSDTEVENIVNFLKSKSTPNYHSAILESPDEASEAEINQVLGLAPQGSSDDGEYDLAVSIILRDRRVSVSYIQRRMEIGYNKAARLVERMEAEGIVSAANHVGKREILVPE